MVSMISLIAVGQTVREYVQGSVGKIGSLVSRLSIRTDRDRSATYHFSINLVPFPSYPSISVVTRKFFLLPCNTLLRGLPLEFYSDVQKSRTTAQRSSYMVKKFNPVYYSHFNKYQHAMDRQTGRNQDRALSIMHCGLYGPYLLQNGTTFAVSAL